MEGAWELSVGICWAAAAAASCLAVAALLRAGHTMAGWALAAGLALWGAEAILAAGSFGLEKAEQVEFWQRRVMVVSGAAPAAWLLFSLCYSRGNAGEFLRRWRMALGLAALLPVGLLARRDRLLEAAADPETPSGWWVGLSAEGVWLSGLLLGLHLVVVAHLERTVRAAVGTLQWRIKYVVVGLWLMLGARIFTGTQSLLFSGHGLEREVIHACALLAGCALMGVGAARRGFSGVDVHPSRAVLQGSLTLLVGGVFLFVVGVLAQAASVLGWETSFHLRVALLTLAGAALAVLLLSQRLRQRVRLLVSRHFQRPQHDFRSIWKSFSQAGAQLMDRDALGAHAAAQFSATFQALSVSLWTVEPDGCLLVCRGSTTAASAPGRELRLPEPPGGAGAPQLQPRGQPLATLQAPWAAPLREAAGAQFSGGAWCLPLQCQGRLLGLALLTDRVDGRSYSAEELELLECLGEHLGTALLNLQLVEDVAVARQMEALRTMSTFFVHDLKNAASTLRLMLQNLPLHFEDPEFRRDALRGISRTAARIDQIISGLTRLRELPAPDLRRIDLHEIAASLLRHFPSGEEVRVIPAWDPQPAWVDADRRQIESVLQNLLSNAREAISGSGCIRLSTTRHNGHTTLTVADDGCGIPPDFLRQSLFRPFATTKKSGLGIGLFQSRLIVEAHGGRIHVESRPGGGTTFQVILPSQP